MNTITHGDCIAEMNRLEAGSVDLVFADPPFNIGYSYDVYRDALSGGQYLDWSREWMRGVHRVLAGNGAFWLAIGDEYAAELKIEAQQLGFHCRSWVVWYYTFGVNCSRKFTRSHAHLFHFVKDPEDFVFRADEPENRIPSARQLVYNDSRANPRGRLPDDTWIIRPADASGEMTDDDGLVSGESSNGGQAVADHSSGGARSPLNGGSGDEGQTSFGDLTPQDGDRTWTLRPQDLEGRFQPGEDTWYFPRVAGTFKERSGFHGCQMPEQLLGRIIRTCSEPGAVVLDPFSGSATTAAVAKKLGRRYLAFDLSEEYVRLGRERLEAIRVGDPLDGSPEPLVSAPRTGTKRSAGRRSAKGGTAAPKAESGGGRDADAAERQLQLTLAGVVEAFAATHAGFSADRVVADPELNTRFSATCREMGLVGEPRSWNMLLFRLRKMGRLAGVPTTQRTTLDWSDCDPFLFASEIAWRMLLDDERAASLDEILCDPDVAQEFDRIASRFAPGFSSLNYRWAALKLRKQSKLARVRAASLSPPTRLGKAIPLDDVDLHETPDVAGVYVLGAPRSGKLYVGEALNLHDRFARQFPPERRDLWREHAEDYGMAKTLSLWVRPLEPPAAGILAWQTCFIQKYRPRLNLAIGQ